MKKKKTCIENPQIYWTLDVYIKIKVQDPRSFLFIFIDEKQ